MPKIIKNSFAHLSDRIIAYKNVTHLLHSRRSMLCCQQIQAKILNKFIHEIFLLTTAITLLNKSGSELAQTGLSALLIGSDTLKTKINFLMTFNELADWLY